VFCWFEPAQPWNFWLNTTMKTLHGISRLLSSDMQWYKLQISLTTVWRSIICSMLQLTIFFLNHYHAFSRKSSRGSAFLVLTIITYLSIYFAVWSHMSWANWIDGRRILITYCFFFPNNAGPKGFALSSYSNEVSTIEPFLIDEKRITPQYVVFWVYKRLAGQGILPVWKEEEGEEEGTK